MSDKRILAWPRALPAVGLGVLVLFAATLLAGCDGLGGGGSESSSGASLAVFPDEDFLIAGLEGGPFFPDEKVYLVTNTGDEPLRWSVRASDATLSFSVSSGTLSSGASELVTVLVNPQVLGGLGAGSYSASIFFTNEASGADVVEHGVLLTISAAGDLEVSPSIGFLSTGPVGGPFQPLSAPYVLSNAGSISIDWSVVVSQPWLSADLSSGTVAAGGSQSLTLSIDPAKAAQLPAGTHVAGATFVDVTNGAEHEVLVTLGITAAATLFVSPDAPFTTSGPAGGPFDPATRTYVLSNGGSELLQWRAASGAAWVSLSSTSGTLAPGQQTSVLVGIDAAETGSLADGTYLDTLVFTNSTNGSGDTTRLVELTITSTPAQMNVTPSQAFSSSGPLGGPFQPGSATYTITNIGGQSMNWMAAVTGSWLQASPPSGSLIPGASAPVVVSIDQALAASMPSGQYSAQVLFTNLTNGTGSTTTGASLTITPPGGSAPVLVPGPGFSGPTLEPGRIGAGSAKAIAHWDVVPYQTIVAAADPRFAVGVVAFHIAGIEKVSFSLEGGPFIDASAMTLNPRTGVWEYWVTMDASAFAADRMIEIRAIAYPKSGAPQAAGTGGYPGGGYPRLLESMLLYVDVGAPETPIVAYCSASRGSDSTGDGSRNNPYSSPWRAAQLVHSNGGGDAGGGIVYMDAGDYPWDNPGGGVTPSTPRRWLTFKPWPGVDPGLVRFVSRSGVMPISKIHLDGLTIHNSWIDGGGDAILWCQGVLIQGLGADYTPNWQGAFGGMDTWYLTDGTTFNDIAGSVSRATLARDVIGHNNAYGPVRHKLAVNCQWTNMNDGNSGAVHPDFLNWNYCPDNAPHCMIENTISYNLKGLNIGAQGIFVKDIPYGGVKDAAFVNVLLELTASAGSPMCGTNVGYLDHWLLWHVTHPGGQPAYFADARTLYRDISIRNCEWGNFGRGTGWTYPDSWFDNNHFSQFSELTLGTNATVGDPLFSSPSTDDYRPQSGSPMLGRGAPLVPTDLDGLPRAASCALGALEP